MALIPYRVMLRMLLGMSVGIAVGCGSSATPAGQAPLANVGAAAPAPASPCELDWIERADRLVVTEREDGHDGTFEFRAELGVRADVLVGAAQARYQRDSSRPLHSMSVDLRLPRPQVAVMLAEIARGVRAPDPLMPGGRIVAREAGRSRSIKIEAAVRLGGVVYHARLETEQGARKPHLWSLAGCERELSFEAQVLVTKRYAELAQLLRRDHVQRVLWKRTP